VWHSDLEPGAISPAEANGDAMSDSLVPRDHAERVALFRAGVIGALTRRELGHGELAAALAALAKHAYRVPGRRATKRFGVSTLERWFSAGPIVMRRCEAFAVGGLVVRRRRGSE
jgi:hypothetical protein